MPYLHGIVPLVGKLLFNGSVINNPTTNGRIKERAVSDIVYIG